MNFIRTDIPDVVVIEPQVQTPQLKSLKKNLNTLNKMTI